MLHRDAFEPGTVVTIGRPGGEEARVEELPLCGSGAAR
jgi:hypothetical protein